MLTSNSLAPFAPDTSRQGIWRQHLEPVSLATGERLFSQGDPAEGMYFIETGQLAVVLELPGMGRVPVRIFGDGQCIGEMSLYRQETRAATVEALAPSQLWRLSAARLARLEETEPRLALAMHRHVACLLAERVVYSNVELKEPLARLSHAIRGLADSEFAESGWDRAAVAAAAKRTDEVGAVAVAIDFLEKRLRAYLEELRRTTAAKEQIESELRIAGQIQASFLPPPLPEEGRRRVDFAATMKPAREAGGDLYDGFFLSDGRFLIVVGDVSGKGVSAALFMAVTAMGVRALAESSPTPGELMERVNRLLCERNDTQQFVTAFAAMIDPASGEFFWANAGHPSACVVRPDGAVVTLDGGRAVPLAVFEECPYVSYRAMLAPGETLLIYTDGVSEAMDHGDALYGDERLKTCLARLGAQSSRPTVDGVLADVLAYAAGAPQADDITVVALRRV